MSAKSLEQILDEALVVERTAANPDEYEQVWPIIDEIREFGREAFDAAVALLKGDAAERCLGCDVLLTLCNPDEGNWSHDAAVAIMDIAMDETDADVCSSIAQAFHVTYDKIAIPALVRLSRHDDDDVRFHVALALTSCDVEHPNNPYVIGTLMALMIDSCVEVRDNATFGVAQLLDADSSDIRNALAERLADSDFATRREAMIGLARRRDARAFDPILEALREGDTDRLVLESVCHLADERFLPYLLALDSDDEITRGEIVEARRACDPVETAFMDATMLAFLSKLDEAFQRAALDHSFGLSSQRFEYGVVLDVESRHSGHDPLTWSFDDLLERSERSLDRAVSLVMADVTKRI
jgi:hypothetical protein